VKRQPPPWSGCELAELLAQLNSTAIDEAMQRHRPAIDDACERMKSKSPSKRTTAAISYFEAIEAVIKEATCPDAHKKEIVDLCHGKRPITDAEARSALHYLLNARELTRRERGLHEFYYARRMKAAITNLAGLSATEAHVEVERRLGVSFDTLRKRRQRMGWDISVQECPTTSVEKCEH
jgi:hypothetical protein